MRDCMVRTTRFALSVELRTNMTAPPCSGPAGWQSQKLPKTCPTGEPSNKLPLSGLRGSMRGYPAQDAKRGYKEWKDAVQRVAHRMRVTIHRKETCAEQTSS